jgi:hypothetical protein
MVVLKAMLLGLASDAVNKFTLVDTQGALSPSDWANELRAVPEVQENSCEICGGPTVPFFRQDLVSDARS